MSAYGLLWMIVNYDIFEQSHALEDRVSHGRFSQTSVEHLARIIKKYTQNTGLGLQSRVGPASQRRFSHFFERVKP
ncbi:hypothetical protein APE01nite_17810 [Acetobacter peroxydans]|uniref:Uncharacterized protein n=1 Tax=Acetobacter peroxydans TaxID=104098 RepID=A0A4Y3TW66_9PROT|nr:hypothetical protein AA13755_0611 [Acetobacter peroxydans NBRC 13755]GBR45198.1 hypothetical protein AA0475_2420 [Acetobacter peroxydans]GEB85984.1 hypothetical protein APE01nite_17810 [Acetobacter peroxydans]